MQRRESSNGSARCILISAGPSTSSGTFYPPTVLRSDAHLFEGCRAWNNHPTPEQEAARPERSIEGIAGYYSGVEAQMVDGNQCIVGTLNFTSTDAGNTAKALASAAMDYQRRYLQSGLIGLSINTDGNSHVETSEELIRRYPEYREGLERQSTWAVVDAFNVSVQSSVDVVTSAGRGGKILSLAESLRRGLSAREWRKQFNHALESAHASTDKRKCIDSDSKWMSDKLTTCDFGDPASVDDFLVGARAYIERQLKAGLRKVKTMKHDDFDDDALRDDEMLDDTDDDGMAEGAARIDSYERYPAHAKSGQSAYAARQELAQKDGFRRYRLPSEVRERRESAQRTNARFRSAAARNRTAPRNAEECVRMLFEAPGIRW